MTLAIAMMTTMIKAMTQIKITTMMMMIIMMGDSEYKNKNFSEAE